MEKPHESPMEQVETPSERRLSNVFSLAVTVGFLVFLVTNDLKGGLTAVQGFFVGFFVVFSLYIVACLLESLSTRSSGERKIYLSVPGNVSILVAGGTADEAMAKFTIILREPPNGGRRQRIKVDLNALMEGKVEDIPLMDDDIIVVPRDKGAKPKDTK